MTRNLFLRDVTARDAHYMFCDVTVLACDLCFRDVILLTRILCFRDVTARDAHSAFAWCRCPWRNSCVFVASLEITKLPQIVSNICAPRSSNQQLVLKAPCSEEMFFKTAVLVPHAVTLRACVSCVYRHHLMFVWRWATKSLGSNLFFFRSLVEILFKWRKK